MIKALVCFHDILLSQPLITIPETQAFAFNRLKPTVWLGWVAVMTLLGIATPSLAVQSAAQFDQTANPHSQAATRQFEETARFAVPPLLLSQADSYLQLDDSGDAVIDLQNRLSRLGYYQGTSDGYFGPQTQAAVIQFQQAQGLTPDGVVGPLTASTLRNPSTASTGANSGSGAGSAVSGNTGSGNPALPQGRFSVAELQRRLQSRGFYQGTIDGVPGPQTRTAIAAAQQFYGITERDILGGRF